MALGKQRGELLTSVAAGDIQTIPPRWLAALGVTTTKQAVPTDVAVTTPATVTVASQVQQERTDERTKLIYTIGDPTGVTLAGQEMDKVTGAMIPYTEELVPAGTAGTALQSDGTYAEVQPLNTLWSLKTTRKSTTLTDESYTSAEQINMLPRVLVQFDTVSFTEKPKLVPFGDASNIDPEFVTPGGNIILSGRMFELLDYNGGYVVTVRERWSNVKHTSLGVTVFRPAGFSWITPYDRGSVPECLHDEITIFGTTGTTHSTFDDNQTWSWTYVATTPASLSGTITLVDSQHRENGGWLRITKTISI